jgi:hypothetical protein
MLYPLPPQEPRVSRDTGPRRGLHPPHPPCQPDAVRPPTTLFPAYTDSPARHRIPTRSVPKHGVLKHSAPKYSWAGARNTDPAKHHPSLSYHQEIGQ